MQLPLLDLQTNSSRRRPARRRVRFVVVDGGQLRLPLWLSDAPRNPAHEQMLVERMRAGDSRAEEALVELYAPFARWLAQSWRIPGLDREDVESAAVLAALDAIRTYDPSRGRLRARVSVWVSSRLQKTLERATRAQRDVRREREMCDEIVSRLRASPSEVVVGWGFSDTEMETLALIASGYSVCDAARERGLSRQAIRQHLDRARLKMLAETAGIATVTDRR